MAKRPSTIFFTTRGMLLYIMFFCCYVSVFAQSRTEQDKPFTYDLRIPDKSKIEEFQKDERFVYEKTEIRNNSLDKFLFWIKALIGRILYNAAESGSASIVVIIAIVILIILVVLKLSGVKFKAILGKKKLDTPEIEIYKENVHQMNFEELINDALKKNNYRLAVRFMYLKNLKILSDKEYIKWNVHKTNYSYQYEISDYTIRQKFIEVTFIFDYIWYGEFSINDSQFSDVRLRMDEFSKTIANEK